ncbi:MAG: hypothetical protein ACE5JU_24340 [Candidatus Binatia bacterium]
MALLKCRKSKFVRIVVVLFVVAAFKATSAAANKVVFEDDFEGCTYDKYQDRARNQIDQNISHSGNCSSKIGGEGVRFGKLIANINPGHTDLWFTAWVFFQSEFQLPAPGGGIHLWRLSNRDFQLDFNVPDRSAVVQLAHFPGNSGGKSVSKWTGFNPITGDRKARWQCWEVHSRLNQPGQQDGLVEFYADGAFVDSISGNFRGNNTSPYTIVDVQSNIGGNEALWPTTNWWYIDDVVVSTERVGCMPDVPDTTPPGTPRGVRFSGQ